MAVPLSSRPSVTILGAGTQGRRLAHMWSSCGRNVHLVDAQSIQLGASIEAVENYRSSRKPNGSQWGDIITHLPEDLKIAIEDSWLVLECVPEQLSLKQKVLVQLDALAPDDVILASNSSSYLCSEILSGLKLQNERRFLSAHTYWPPETTEIEIMGHKTTNPAHIPIMMEQSRAHGFSPFHVKTTTSMGYIYNRIWAAIKREALLAAAEGAATPEEIDAIFRGILKTPKGPFELMDVVGLDVVRDIEQHYADMRQDVPAEPRAYLDRYLENGHLGVKSGRGFYDYSDSSSSSSSS